MQLIKFEGFLPWINKFCNKYGDAFTFQGSKTPACTSYKEQESDGAKNQFIGGKVRANDDVKSEYFFWLPSTDSKLL